MTDERAQVLEQQVDELAKQVAGLRERLDRVVGVLTSPEATARLKWDTTDIARFAQPAYTTSLADMLHGMRRNTLTREAERNAAIDRLLRQAERT